MNCRDFEAMTSDLARGQIMDAAQHETALSHAASCECCASKLADERALTDGLRFVAQASDEQAPARVETALLAAFREQRPLPLKATARIVKRPWLYVAAGVAAAAVIVALFALVISRARDSQPPAPQHAEVPRETGPSSPEPQVAPSSPEHKAVSGQIEEHKSGVNAKRPPQSKSGDRSKHASVDRKKPVDAEIATDFIPLMNRESLAELDGGQVMRVELPRSALMSFGLPMNMERAAERIKADVVVGNDGLARAIRFVR